MQDSMVQGTPTSIGAAGFAGTADPTSRLEPLGVPLARFGAILRRHYRHPLNLTEQQKRLRLLVRLGCAVLLVFLVCFIEFFLMAFLALGQQPYPLRVASLQLPCAV